MMNGQLEAVGFIAGTWTDESIAWGGTQFDDIPRLAFEQGEGLWTPDIAQFDTVGEEVEKVSAVVEKDGTVGWGVSKRYTTFCNLNIRFYPNDAHSCDFEFLSLHYSTSELRIEHETLGLDLAQMRQHGEWVVKDTSVSSVTRLVLGRKVQGVVYTVVFDRRSEFILLHKVMPLLLLVISNIFVHLVPLTSGERISYAVTVLLAFVFWQAIVTEGLPQNSAKISLVSCFMSICMSFSAVSTVLSVILCRLASSNTQHSIPVTLVKLVKRIRCKDKYRYPVLNKHRLKETKHKNSNNASFEHVHAVDDNRRASKHVALNRSKDRTLRGIETGDRHLKPNISLVDSEKAETSKRKVTWLEAANALDIVALTILVVSSVVLAVGFLVAYLLES